MKTPAQELKYKQAVNKFLFDVTIILLVYSPWIIGFIDLVSLTIYKQQVTLITWPTGPGILIAVAPLICLMFLYVTQALHKFFTTNKKAA